MEGSEGASERAFMRRIKRHIRAKEHQFAAAIPYEFIGICRKELESLGVESVEPSEAGLEFRGKFDACYRTNLWLRTASRIFCRFPAFRAGAREELYAKVLRIPWELWLPREIPVKVEATVVQSRIAHAPLARKAVSDAIRRRLQQLGLNVDLLEGKGKTESGGTDAGPVMPRVQRLLVRLEKNRCTLSLDTTGPHLHRRGYRLKHTGAPLRETLAAALILRSGWDPGKPLVDGMCGSGTFAIEAALISANVPPGRFRRFLFEWWPSFQEKTWRHMLKKADEASAGSLRAPVVGLDRDLRAIRVAKENALRAGFEKAIRWEALPFERFDPSASGLSRGFVFLNPPYGVRLSGGDWEMYRRLLKHLREAFQGWEAVLLAPAKEFLMEKGIRPRRIWTVRHGGLSIFTGFYRL